MCSTRSEIVVGFIGMSKLSVCECRLNRSAKNRRGHYRGNLLAAICPSKLDRQASGEQLGSRNHGGKSVQNVMFRFLHHIFRQRTISSLSHICAELCHYRIDILVGGRCHTRKRCSGCYPGRVLQPTTPG